MAKKKKKNKPGELTTDDALKRLFGKEAPKRLREMAEALDAGKDKKKKKKKNKKNKKNKKR